MTELLLADIAMPKPAPAMLSKALLPYGKIPREMCSHLLPLPAFVASSFLGVPCVGDCPEPDFSSFFTTSCEGCKKTQWMPCLPEGESRKVEPQTLA